MNYFQISTPNDRIIIKPNSLDVKLEIDKSDFNLLFSKVKKIPFAAQHLIGWLENDGDMCFTLDQHVGNEIVKTGICIFEYINVCINQNFHTFVDITFHGIFYRKEK